MAFAVICTGHLKNRRLTVWQTTAGWQTNLSMGLQTGSIATQSIRRRKWQAVQPVNAGLESGNILQGTRSLARCKLMQKQKRDVQSTQTSNDIAIASCP